VPPNSLPAGVGHIGQCFRLAVPPLESLGVLAAGRRYIKSGSGRARGPDDDERSGVDFVIRTIGRHSNKKPAGTPVKATDSDSDKSESEDDMGIVGSVGSVGSVGESRTRPQNVQDDSLVADPLTMSNKQLKEIAGDSAEDLACAYFQHTARVTQPAFFRHLSSLLSITTEKGETRLFRKGQAANQSTHMFCCKAGVCSEPHVANL